VDVVQHNHRTIFLKKNLKKFKRKIISSDKEMTGDGTWMMSHNV